MAPRQEPISTPLPSARVLLALLASVLLAACGPSATPPLVPPAPPTESAFPATAVAFTQPPPPAATPTFPAIRIPCTDDAAFLEDLSIPDGTRVVPGEEIDKRWSVRNTGTCDWGPGYRLVRTSTDGLGGPHDIPLYPARSGTDAVWQVIFTAPDQPGDYVSEWQAETPEGVRFGEEVFVYVVVEPGPTATP
jgi:hypothetical protein